MKQTRAGPDPVDVPGGESGIAQVANPRIYPVGRGQPDHLTGRVDAHNPKPARREVERVPSRLRSRGPPRVRQPGRVRRMLRGSPTRHQRATRCGAHTRLRSGHRTGQSDRGLNRNSLALTVTAALPCRQRPAPQRPRRGELARVAGGARRTAGEVAWSRPRPRRSVGLDEAVHQGQRRGRRGRATLRPVGAGS